MRNINILELKKDVKALTVHDSSTASCILGGASPQLPDPPPFRGNTVMLSIKIKF